jgi:hypothetical protein
MITKLAQLCKQSATEHMPGFHTKKSGGQDPGTSDVGEAVFTRPRPRQGRDRCRLLEAEAMPRQNVRGRGDAVREPCKYFIMRHVHQTSLAELLASINATFTHEEYIRCETQIQKRCMDESIMIMISNVT